MSKENNQTHEQNASLTHDLPPRDAVKTLREHLDENSTTSQSRQRARNMKTATFEQAKRFLERNYKYERLYGRGKEYGDCVVNSELESLKQLANGELDSLCISRYEHATGQTVFYGLAEVLAGELLMPEQDAKDSSLKKTTADTGESPGALARRCQGVPA